MNSQPSCKETIVMAHTECPWCAGQAAFVAEGPTVAPAAFECGDCGVRVEVASDPVVAVLARAA